MHLWYIIMDIKREYLEHKKLEVKSSTQVKMPQDFKAKLRSSKASKYSLVKKEGENQKYFFRL